MGMIASLYTLSDANIAKAADNPLLLEKVFDPANPQAYDRARQREMPGWLDRLLGKKAPQRSDPELFVLDPEEGRDVDIDKAWHGLHYLLTKTAWEGEPPLDFLVRGGREVDDTNRLFSAGEVAGIDAALAPIDTALLRTRFDPADMDRLEIYPLIWSEDNGGLDYCLAYFDDLKDFIRQAAARGLGMVLSCG